VGFVTILNAKQSPELGLKKEVHAIYHQNHIDKVMAVAFTGYTVNDHVENGGDGLKLRFFRVQSALEVWKGSANMATGIKRATAVNI
jgi:hypothetical protein